jgi:hypothetical protein
MVGYFSIENPEVKKRIRQMKTEIGITESPDQAKKLLLKKEKYSDAEILKFAEKDSNASEKTNRQENKGSFSLAAANRTEVAKNDET